jgi:putative ABC transport system permease protein
MRLTTFIRGFLHLVKSNIVSVAGLMAGMMVMVFSVDYMVFENSFDSFHRNKKRIYHVSTQMASRSGEDALLSRTHYQLKDYMDEQVPRIERSCRVLKTEEVLVRGQEKFRGHLGLYADADFFRIFDFKVISGQPSCLEVPGQMMLTRSLARKLFGPDDCLGSEIRHAETSYTVCGIIDDPPANSNLQFEYLLPIRQFIDSLDLTYDQVCVETYLLARYRLEDPGILNASLHPFFTMYGIGESDTYRLQLESITGRNPFSGDRTSYYFLLISITLLVLVVSVVNFINSFAAGCEQRKREFMIRKIIGASRALLVRTMLLQSVMMSLIGSAGALLLTGVLLGPYKKLSGQDIAMYGPGLWKIQVIVLVTAILTGLLGGLFPSIKYTSRVHNNSTRDRRAPGRGKFRFSKVTVLSQLCISGSLLIILFLFTGQLRFLSSKDPGYEMQNRILIRVDGPLVSSYQKYIEELRSIPSVITVSGSILEFGGTIGLGIKKDEESDYRASMGFIVQDGFFKAYGIKLANGITFEESSGRDAGSVIIDRSTAQILGMDQPVGKEVFVAGRKMRVIGLVEDADLIAMKGPRMPFCYTQLADQCGELVVHYRGDAGSVAMEIARRLKTFDPDFEYNYRKLEEARNQLYSEERMQVQMVLIVVAVAVLITMGGAYSLTRYQVSRRAGEISIRKVLGASVAQVVTLTVTDMIWMTGIAFLIAAPFAYLFTSKWLQDFTHRIRIGPGSFILALLCLSILILATVLSRALQAARANPVDQIRNE